MDLSTHAAANFWFPTQTSEAEGPYYTTPPSRPISPGGLLQDTGLITPDKSHTMTKHCDCALITFKGHQ